MNTQPKQIPSQCLTSLQIELAASGIDRNTLERFISESLDLSHEHFKLISPTLSRTQKLTHTTTRFQVELFLSLLRRTKVLGG